MRRSLFFFLCLFTQLSALNKKILICGAAQNISESLEYTMRNMEELGRHFEDYKIIIYENNSEDITPFVLQDWADTNPHVHLISEYIPKPKLATSRTERISDARNRILIAAQNYPEFDYLLMADLDFMCDWPIDEIIKTVESPIEWDSVSCNGIDEFGYYVDKYALRSKEYPFGPELLGFQWWQMAKDWCYVFEGNNWIPVYSAFGGMAIYRMSSLHNCYYSGSTTAEMKNLYRKILSEVDPENLLVLLYKLRLHLSPGDRVPIVFTYNTSWEHAMNHLLVTCCEHVGLHAEMHKRGHNKFFVNPKMVMRY